MRLEQAVVVCPQSTGQGQQRAQNKKKCMVVCQKHLLLKAPLSHTVDIFEKKNRLKRHQILCSTIVGPTAYHLETPISLSCIVPAEVSLRPVGEGHWSAVVWG